MEAHNIYDQSIHPEMTTLPKETLTLNDTNNLQENILPHPGLRDCRAYLPDDGAEPFSHRDRQNSGLLGFIHRGNRPGSCRTGQGRCSPVRLWDFFSEESGQRCRAKSSGSIFDYNLSGSLRQIRDSPSTASPYIEVPFRLRARGGRSLNTSDLNNSHSKPTHPPTTRNTHPRTSPHNAGIHSKMRLTQHSP